MMELSPTGSVVTAHSPVGLAIDLAAQDGFPLDGTAVLSSVTNDAAQQSIRARNSHPPEIRARQTMVGAGCFSSNFLDTQPQIGDTLPE